MSLICIVNLSLRIAYITWKTSGFRKEVDEKCDLTGYYASSRGNFLEKFRDNLSFPLQVNTASSASLAKLAMMSVFTHDLPTPLHEKRRK